MVEKLDKGVAPTKNSLYLCYIRALFDGQIKIVTKAADLQMIEGTEGCNHVRTTISSSSHQLVYWQQPVFKDIQDSICYVLLSMIGKRKHCTKAKWL